MRYVVAAVLLLIPIAARAQGYAFGYATGACVVPSMSCLMGAQNRQAIDRLEAERQERLRQQTCGRDRDGRCVAPSRR